ncbi:hypothetical protein SDJN03_04912, partial [Cucurbita argyrosperma subsp. sororia]
MDSSSQSPSEPPAASSPHPPPATTVSSATTSVAAPPQSSPNANPNINPSSFQNQNPNSKASKLLCPTSRHNSNSLSPLHSTGGISIGVPAHQPTPSPQPASFSASYGQHFGGLGRGGVSMSEPASNATPSQSAGKRQILSILVAISLLTREDYKSWSLHQIGKLSVKSPTPALGNVSNCSAFDPFLIDITWKAKVPKEVKVSLWTCLQENEALTI